jgi:hypothetical protein
LPWSLDFARVNTFISWLKFEEIDGAFGDFCTINELPFTFAFGCVSGLEVVRVLHLR